MRQLDRLRDEYLRPVGETVLVQTHKAWILRGVDHAEEGIGAVGAAALHDGVAVRLRNGADDVGRDERGRPARGQHLTHVGAAGKLVGEIAVPVLERQAAASEDGGEQIVKRLIRQVFVRAAHGETTVRGQQTEAAAARLRELGIERRARRLRRLPDEHARTGRLFIQLVVVVQLHLTAELCCQLLAESDRERGDGVVRVCGQHHHRAAVRRELYGLFAAAGSQ